MHKLIVSQIKQTMVTVVRFTLTVSLDLEYKICKMFIAYAKCIVNIYFYRDTFVICTGNCAFIVRNSVTLTNKGEQNTIIELP